MIDPPSSPRRHPAIAAFLSFLFPGLGQAYLGERRLALMLALLPATATAVGAIVLLQIPSLRDMLGIALVMGGVALHKQPTATKPG